MREIITTSDARPLDIVGFRSAKVRSSASL
jgi:hypothetical protein